jgi:DNA ligase-associated metallophosphoesterase
MAWVELGGERLQLLPQKAVYWPAQRALLVADLHLGKAHSFRLLGVPVPRGSTAESLQALAALVAAHDVGHLVFLGDFLHARSARSTGVLVGLQRWRAAHAALRLTLVRGNHDTSAGDPPAALGIACVDEPLRLGGLALCHHPRPVPDAYTLAGHLHPCVTVGRGFDRLRLPCFHFGAEAGVLPAFGAFTGMHAVERLAGDRVFVSSGDTVVAWPTG